MSASVNSQIDPSHEDVDRQIRRMTRRSFAWGAAASAAGVMGLGWLRSSSLDDGTAWPLRRVLRLNERLARAYFRPTRLAPTFAKSVARMPRVNGRIGLNDSFDPSSWTLTVEQSSLQRPLQLTIDDIQKLPRVEMVTELKCVEGWSDPVYWAGVRLADLVAMFGLATRSGRTFDPKSAATDLFQYATLATPDDDYYVGLDIESALHPQTLLCYELNGEPLSLEHGAPLRLVIPVKYGIKNIKRIGTIRFGDERPGDYWAERGYDWYAGH